MEHRQWVSFPLATALLGYHTLSLFVRRIFRSLILWESIVIAAKSFLAFSLWCFEDMIV
jgi:hypothetical protein